MSIRILRRLKAAEDAESIANYIAQDSLTAALRFLENLQLTLKELNYFPKLATWNREVFSMGTPTASSWSSVLSGKQCSFWKAIRISDELSTHRMGGDPLRRQLVAESPLIA